MKRTILAVAVVLAGCAGEPRHGDGCEQKEARNIICGVSPRDGQDQVAALRCDPDTQQLNAIALCGECEADGSSQFRCDGRLQAWHEDPCEDGSVLCGGADSVLRCEGGAWTSEKCSTGQSCTGITESPRCI